MYVFREVRIDIDLDKQHPCQVPIRLIRLLTFFTWMHPAPIDITATGRGFHVRVLVPPWVSDEALLVVRGCFGDDFDRLSLDYARVRKGARQRDILFVGRVKTYDGKSLRKVGSRRFVAVPVSETELSLRELSRLLDELLLECSSLCLGGGDSSRGRVGLRRR